VSETCTWAAAFHVHNPELQDDPYPRFEELRQHCPVARSEVAGGFYVFSRYDDVHHILQHPEVFSSTANTVPPVIDEIGPAIPTQIDPPEHTRYRQILAPAFTPNAVRRIEGSIRATAIRLLEPIAARGRCDFLAEFAVPFPCEIFVELMGLPTDDLPMFLAWKDEILRAGTSADREVMLRVMNGVRADLFAYLGAEYDRRSAAGIDEEDLIGALMRTGPDGEAPLDRDEFLRTSRLIFLAGLDTVTAQLGLAVDRLASDLRLRDELVRDPSLIPSAVEELIRYDSIVSMARKVVQPTEVGGQRLEPGDMVMVLLGSADRDEAHFDRPDEIDLHREANRHLGFGAGPHRCIGSHLARLELVVALEEIHRVLPTYRLDPDRPVRRHLGYVRGVDDLHLLLDPRTTA
jgi:cytochrome P450